MKLRSQSSKGKKIIEFEESLNEEKESQDAAASDSEYMDYSEDLDETVPERRKVGPGSRGRRQRMKEEVQNHAEPANENTNAEMFVPNFHEGGKQDVSENEKPIEKKKRRKRKGRPILMWKVWEEENERWFDENEGKSVDLDDQNNIQAESVEPPSTLVMPLLRYQKEWLAWALRQEESTRGGILADEMGMGKTVQAIALVLAKKEIRREFGSFIPSVPSSSTSLPAVKGTLVICPLVALSQWENEINRFTLKGSSLVFVYHGSNRTTDVGEVSKYDFVITTYSIVSTDYRKNTMPPTHKCESCGKLLYGRNLTRHWRFVCGPYARRTSKHAKQQRKTPKLETKMLKQNLLSDDDEAGGSNVETSKRGYEECAKGNREYNVPVDDCSTDNSAGSKQSESPRRSILHSVNWDRVILDEAHYIKNRRSNTTRAILALKSSFKWALSGTPLQNHVDELHSIVRFLEIVPYSYYLCKDCDCRILDYNSLSTECPQCPHKLMRHFCWWKKYITSPMASMRPALGKRAMLLLKNKILRTTVLRRTKEVRASDLGLPPRMVTIRRDSLDIREEDFYTTLSKESQAQFNTYVEARTLMTNYAHIFELLIRLRQAVDHPYLVVYSSTAGERTEGITDVGNSEKVCGLCHETVEEAVVTSCLHVFCKSCLIDFSASMEQVSCPFCSKPFTVDFTGSSGNEDKMSKTTVEGFKRSSILKRIRLDDFQTSTKIDALKEEIRFMIERDGSAKGLVFSQFLAFLDLIHYSLEKSGVCCVQLVGTMTMAARDAAIKKFTDDPECRIFLLSLKTGGVALNLTMASHVFLMDPWWNPAVEKQAQDRIYRIGQYKPIRIVRFIMKNTIEERIMKLQEKKEFVFEKIVGGSTEACTKLTEADLKYLLGVRF